MRELCRRAVNDLLGNHPQEVLIGLGVLSFVYRFLSLFQSVWICLFQLPPHSCVPIEFVNQ